jgi:peptidoglycan/LPS O-acetylase OafA/YrhL
MGGQPGYNRVPALDGWRGIAILLVIFDHANLPTTGLLHKLSRTGATGVGLFFALSGFLITTRLLNEHVKYGKISLTRFYIRRAFRLIPASLTYLFVLAILAGAGVLAVTREQWTASLLFFRNYIPTDSAGSGWFTAHFWSLAVEEHFYLLWPALLIRTNRKAFVPIVLACLVAAWRYVDFRYHVVQAQLWFPGRSDVRMDGLLWGCALAILLNQPTFRQKCAQVYRWWIVLLFCIADVASNVLAGKHNYSAYEPVLLGLILVWPVLHSQSWLARLLETKPLKWLGALSYSLYIWQQLWLVFPGVPSGLQPIQAFPLNLTLGLACACLSYYLVEKPMITLGHRRTSQRGSQPTLLLPESSAA